MCYGLKASTLARVGGFDAILHHLTDDLAMAMHLTSYHVNLFQSVAAVNVQTSISNTGQYFRQMHRWFLFATLLLKQKSISMNMVIFLLQGLHPLLLWAIVIWGISNGIVGIGILLSCFIVRHLVLRNIQQQVAADIPSRPLLSLFSELLQPIHLLHALVNRTIYWRTRRYRVFSNDRFLSL